MGILITLCMDEQLQLQQLRQPLQLDLAVVTAPTLSILFQELINTFYKQNTGQ